MTNHAEELCGLTGRAFTFFGEEPMYIWKMSSFCPETVSQIYLDARPWAVCGLHAFCETVLSLSDGVLYGGGGTKLLILMMSDNNKLSLSFVFVVSEILQGFYNSARV